MIITRHWGDTERIKMNPKDIDGSASIESGSPDKKAQVDIETFGGAANTILGRLKQKRWFWMANWIDRASRVCTKRQSRS